MNCTQLRIRNDWPENFKTTKNIEKVRKLTFEPKR